MDRHNLKCLTSACSCVHAQSLQYVRLFVLPWTHVTPASLLWPWDFPGKNTGVGCRALLQGLFLTRESNCDTYDSYMAGRCFTHWDTWEAPASRWKEGKSTVWLLNGERKMGKRKNVVGGISGFMFLKDEREPKNERTHNLSLSMKTN